MSSEPEFAIWSRDTGQQIPCFDSRQTIINWMSNIKDVPMVIELLSYFSRYGPWRTDSKSREPKFLRLMGYQIFYGSVCAPLVLELGYNVLSIKILQ